MSENKTGKYFKYAIGEILLVIIGIIIALQINNWNQNIQDQKRLNSYLKLLVQDLEKDKLILQECLVFDEEKEKYIRRTLTLSKKDTIKNFVKAFKTKSLIIHDATYKSMSSGNILELIKSPKIQNSISFYYSNMENVKRFEDRHLNSAYNSLINELFNVNEIADHMKNSGSIENLEVYKVTNKLRAHLIHSANISQIEVGYYKDLLNEIEVLAKLIIGEIDNQ